MKQQMDGNHEIPANNHVDLSGRKWPGPLCSVCNDTGWYVIQRNDRDYLEQCHHEGCDDVIRIIIDGRL